MAEITRKQKAYNLFKEGYNCCQSVVLAFEDILPFDRKQLLGVSCGFGGGFGRTRNLCGAVSAYAIVMGLYLSHSDDPKQAKADMYKILQDMVAKFKERNGSDNCAELLKEVKNLTVGYMPQERDEEYYKIRPCVKFVLDSVEIIEEQIKSL